MALPRVNPGDLITARMWNDAMEEIERRIGALEAGEPQGASPDGLQLATPGALQPGAWAVLLGRNLGASTRRLRMYFETRTTSRDVVRFDGALYSDTAVRFQVPEFSLDRDITPMTLVVSNGAGQGSLAVEIQRVVSPLERSLIDVVYAGSNPSTLAQGAQATFRFTVTLRAGQRVTFNARASLLRDGASAIPLTMSGDGSFTIDGPGVATVEASTTAVPAVPFRVALSLSAPGVPEFPVEHLVSTLNDRVDTAIGLGAATALFRGPGPTRTPVPNVNDGGETCAIPISLATAGGRTVALATTATLTRPDGATSVNYRWSLTLVSGVAGVVDLSPSSANRTVDAADFGTVGAVQWPTEIIVTPRAAGTASWQLAVERVGHPEGRRTLKTLVFTITS
jgi:hypothetical protein